MTTENELLGAAVPVGAQIGRCSNPRVVDCFNQSPAQAYGWPAPRTEGLRRDSDHVEPATLPSAAGSRSWPEVVTWSPTQTTLISCCGSIKVVIGRHLHGEAVRSAHLH